VWPAAAALLVLTAFVPARVSADSSATLRDKASRLSRQNVDLSARAHSVLLELYGLDSWLARERARIVALRIETADVRAARRSAEHRLAVARRSLTAAERLLSLRLQQLYEQGDTDPVAVILGAQSMSEALNNLDTLNRVAGQDKLVIRQTRTARRNYTTQLRALAARQRRLAGLSQQAEETAATLERARAQRASYLAGLAARRRLNSSAIANLEQQAQSIQTRSAQISTVAGSPVRSGSTITVTATGYSMRGRTSTGAPVGWGVVAVDPSTIPLGTRMSIPGYGDGFAADTGSAIRGAAIDLWFPTLAQARAWGRRTVTITLH
jgi:cystine transport system substrate-binding protein